MDRLRRYCFSLIFLRLYGLKSRSLHKFYNLLKSDSIKISLINSWCLQPDFSPSSFFKILCLELSKPNIFTKSCWRFKLFSHFDRKEKQTYDIQRVVKQLPESSQSKGWSWNAGRARNCIVKPSAKLSLTWLRFAELNPYAQAPKVFVITNFVKYHRNSRLVL